MCYSLREICIETGLKKVSYQYLILLYKILFLIILIIIIELSLFEFHTLLKTVVFKKLCNRIILKFLFHDYFFYLYAKVIFKNFHIRFYIPKSLCNRQSLQSLHRYYTITYSELYSVFFHQIKRKFL